MKEIVIVGAGAIGRGFLPWFLDDNHDFLFVDVKPDLVRSLNRAGKYSTFMSKGGVLRKKTVPVKRAYLLEEFSRSCCRDPEAVFMNVGPRNCLSAASCLSDFTCPIILTENDPETVKSVSDYLGVRNVYFSIPDVITSNTASPANLKKDPLAIHTEDGTLFVDDAAARIGGNINYCSTEELGKQWTAKLYLHNTPHCIAAYLGALVGAVYLHESMDVPAIRSIVEGSMNEMLTALKLRWDIPHGFLEWYARKEIARFSNTLLFDPVSRVAREPLRKLELEGRLIGAAQICLSQGFIPRNILTGITSAILFEDERDADRHLSFLRRTIPPEMLLTHVLGLRKGEVLELVMSANFARIVEQLESITRSSRKGGKRR